MAARPKTHALTSLVPPLEENDLAILLEKRGDMQSAEPMLRESVAASLNNLAMLQ